MNIIIDANIVFSALIKDSFTRRIIFDYPGYFIFPLYLYIEFKTHESELIGKSGLSRHEFDELFESLLRKMELIPDIELEDYIGEANEIVKDIDPDDVLFFACALAFKDSIIWSNDKRLKSQKQVKVLNTKEIISLLT